MSNDAICTSANGRDITTEIREPLGSGIDHAREAVAILGVSFRVRIQLDALKAYSANAESLQANDVDAAEMSGVEKTLHNQFTVRHCSGQGY
jgi:hypothetical protein